MNVRICDIATELVAEGVSIPTILHEFFSKFSEDMNDNELAGELRNARSVMLDILLRLRNKVHTDRKTELEADKFWDGSMRQHFAEDAEKLAAEPKIRELYKEVNEDGEQPINDFIDGVDEKIDQDLAMFVYNMLSEDPAMV